MPAMAAAGSAHHDGWTGKPARMCLRPHTSHRKAGTMKKPCEKVLELLQTDTIDALVGQNPTATATSTAATPAKARLGLLMQWSSPATATDYMPLSRACISVLPRKSPSTAASSLRSALPSC